jgi:hypothetical protein
MRGGTVIVHSGTRPSTWRRCAFALVVWLTFLQVSGRSWNQASLGDVEAFKGLTDARIAGRVAPVSFDTDRAALDSFYGWASARHGTGPSSPPPRASCPACGHGPNERRHRGFFPMLSMSGHPSGGKPLMTDVRQSGSVPPEPGWPCPLTRTGLFQLASVTWGAR